MAREKDYSIQSMATLLNKVLNIINIILLLKLLFASTMLSYLLVDRLVKGSRPKFLLFRL